MHDWPIFDSVRSPSVELPSAHTHPVDPRSSYPSPLATRTAAITLSGTMGSATWSTSSRRRRRKRSTNEGGKWLLCVVRSVPCCHLSVHPLKWLYDGQDERNWEKTTLFLFASILSLNFLIRSLFSPPLAHGDLRSLSEPLGRSGGSPALSPQTPQKLSPPSDTRRWKSGVGAAVIALGDVHC